MKKNKSKLFPYGIEYREVIGYSTDGKNTPIYRIKRTLPKHLKKSNKLLTCFKVITIFSIILIGLILAGCSSKPIVDSRGKSSANINGDMNRFHDDYYTCQDIVKDNTNSVADKGKILYNSFRWRVLWLSPKIQTRTDLINNCLEGRGYNILNK
tara:strand:+ start:201 stop:662 length:462 start_codon:yes stop_codon:yes gene_type:complete